jgi:hypothetical protein
MDDGQDPHMGQSLEGLNIRDDSNFANLTMLMAIASQTGANVCGLERLVNDSGLPEGNKEKERIAGRLQGFNPKDNQVWKEITRRFGSNIKQPELLSVANVLASNAHIKLDRDAKRRKTVLVKWFEENWVSIRPFLDYVVLEEANRVN